MSSVAFTSNRAYAVVQGEPWLWIRGGAGARVELSTEDGKPLTSLERTRVRMALAGYTPYAFPTPIAGDKNDCLMFAESIVAQGTVPDRYPSTCMFVVGAQKLKFGMSDAQNKACAVLEEGIDALAAPRVGEAFCIQNYVEKDVGEGCAPYHVALVVARAGATVVTMEADAGTPELTLPVFYIYGGSHATFHDRYKAAYGGTAARTVVLRPSAAVLKRRYGFTGGSKPRITAEAMQHLSYWLNSTPHEVIVECKRQADGRVAWGKMLSEGAGDACSPVQTGVRPWMMHTHPRACYTRKGTYYGWPSGADFGAFLEQQGTEHWVCALEGLYVLKAEEGAAAKWGARSEDAQDALVLRWDIPSTTPDDTPEKVLPVLQRRVSGWCTVEYYPWTELS